MLLISWDCCPYFGAVRCVRTPWEMQWHKLRVGQHVAEKASSSTCRLGPEAMLVFVHHHELIV